MTTSYFTFGQAHRHEINGIVFDKDCVVKITGEEPRGVMFGLFGRQWSMEYFTTPDMKHYPRGIIEIPSPRGWL